MHYRVEVCKKLGFVRRFVDTYQNFLKELRKKSSTRNKKSRKQCGAIIRRNIELCHVFTIKFTLISAIWMIRCISPVIALLY